LTPGGPNLILRRANVLRKGSPWQHDDYDVVDGDHDVGRIFQQAAFKAQYEAWKRKTLWSARF
jgi:hypothetical protein